MDVKKQTAHIWRKAMCLVACHLRTHQGRIGRRIETHYIGFISHPFHWPGCIETFHVPLTIKKFVNYSINLVFLESPVTGSNPDEMSSFNVFTNFQINHISWTNGLSEWNVAIIKMTLFGVFLYVHVQPLKTAAPTPRSCLEIWPLQTSFWGQQKAERLIFSSTWRRRKLSWRRWSSSNSSLSPKTFLRHQQRQKLGLPVSGAIAAGQGPWFPWHWNRNPQHLSMMEKGCSLGDGYWNKLNN